MKNGWELGYVDHIPVVEIPTICTECNQVKMIPEHEYPVCTECYFKLLERAEEVRDE